MGILFVLITNIIEVAEFGEFGLLVCLLLIYVNILHNSCIVKFYTKILGRVLMLLLFMGLIILKTEISYGEVWSLLVEEFKVGGL